MVRTNCNDSKSNASRHERAFKNLMRTNYNHSVAAGKRFAFDAQEWMTSISNRSELNCETPINSGSAFARLRNYYEPITLRYGGSPKFLDRFKQTSKLNVVLWC